MALWNQEQVLALAPDAASVKAGQALANPAKWVRLEQNERAVWGECQGSGKDPYRTQVDLNGPAFHCSCPSRKFPCKHGLGLMLIFAGKPQQVKAAEPPPWVTEWLAKREASAERKAAKAADQTEPADPETAARREADREKRAVKREERVRDGLAELQTWLNDVIRQGLAHAQSRPAQFWDGMAARMIDCQAPGVARVLRQLPGIFAAGENWAGRALEQFGLLQWLLHGFRRSETLPPDFQSDVRAAIGWTVTDEELASSAPVSDRWQIVGQRIEEDERLKTQRTWLIGENSGRRALCLSFSAGNQPLDVSLVPGAVIEAELAFYPSRQPLRATVRQRQGEPTPLRQPKADASFVEALDRTAHLAAGNPWLERYPWMVQDCVPLRQGETWALRDAQGQAVPFSRSFPQAWPLFALSGGNPVTIFGEWNGHHLLPLSVVSEGKFTTLGGLS